MTSPSSFTDHLSTRLKRLDVVADDRNMARLVIASILYATLFPLVILRAGELLMTA